MKVKHNTGRNTKNTEPDSDLHAISKMKSGRQPNIKNADEIYIKNETKLNPHISPELKKILGILFDKCKSFKNGHFNPITIAYMARWGTGKTSAMLNIKESTKKHYNFVNVNLWKFSNTKTNGDTNIVRSMVNDIFGQISSNKHSLEELNSKTTDLKTNSFQVNIFAKFYKIFGINVNAEHKNKQEVTRERFKFADEFLMFLSIVISELTDKTNKPTIIILDDLDRVELTKVKEILDSIISFLFIKNVVYIFPIDEKHVLEGIKLSTGINKNPYDSMNKYFNYSIRAPFIPLMNKYKMLSDIIADNFNNINHVECNEMFENNKVKDIIAQSSSESFRSLKDFTNNYIFNYSLVKDNLKDFKKMKQINPDYVAFGSSIQILIPKLVDRLLAGPHMFKELTVLQNINISSEELFKTDLIKHEKLLPILFWDPVSKTDNIENFIITDWEYNNISNAISIMKIIDLKEIVQDGIELIKLWMSTTLAVIKGDDALDFVEVSGVIDDIMKIGEYEK